MEFIHKNTSFSFGKDIRHANTMFSRMKGLMFSKEMIGDGIILDPGNSIHNCFVRFPIDVIFLNNDFKIIKIIRSFKPWRFSWIYFKATKVLELPQGKIPKDVKEGDYLEVRGV
jgi:uncharacterized membrane protein (UPF0127 family)